MNKKIVVIIAIAVFVFYILNHDKSSKYYVISDEQISGIIEKEKIIMLDKEVIMNKDIPITVISYKDNSEIGSIEALNNNGKLEYRKALVTHLNYDKKVEVLGVNAGAKYVILTFYEVESIYLCK